jgi:UDP-2,3-diacylglucosamine hydrolase
MIYFISDVHLGLGEREADKQRERDLIKVLQKIEKDCEKLFIVGDLFDYWFEYATVIPRFHIRTIAAIAGLRDRGIPIEYVMGNHDFGHRDFFKTELDIEVFKTDIEREISGKKFYIGHGDGKAFNDTGYLILKRLLRAPLSLKLWQWLHPDIGIGLAAGTSRKSRGYTDAREADKWKNGEKDGLEDFAEKRIADGFDYVIMGHRHKPVIKPFKSGFYVNLGDWLVHRTFGRFDGEKMEILKVDEFLKE